MRKFSILALACLLSGCPAPTSNEVERPLSKDAPQPVAVKPFASGQPQIVLLVTGGGNGLLEVCNCSGPMPGGLSRRSGLAISYRAAFPNVVMIDAGDAFWRSGDHPANEFVLHGLGQIGYDALTLGDQEWMAADQRTHALFAPGKLEYLSTTVSEAPAAGRAPLPVTRVVKRDFGAAKLAILSDLRPQWNLLWSPEQLKKLNFAPPNELPGLVDQLHKEGYVVAVICHGDAAALKETADSCAADFFIHGHKSKAETSLLSISGRPVLNARGSEFVGALGIWTKPQGGLANLEYRLETVDKPFPIDDRVLQTYKEYTKVAMQQALAANPRPGLEYASSAQCGHCHKAIYENWKKTQHSHAYQTLVDVKRTADPACISCHTSGFGTQKGFVTIEKTPGLANVNCQDCHPVDFTSHARKPAKLPPVTEETCRKCHTDVTSPKFSYTPMRKIIQCPKSHATTTNPAFH